jgi:two-component system OmpR family sensor kinase
VCRQARLIAPGYPILYEPSADEMTVLGDRDALKQVLLILIDNAHVHTSLGTVIAVSAVGVEGYASISVHDTGPGIAPDALPHIFERFYRGDGSRSGASAGLGLAIAKELVEGQGGTISVASESGQGSVFTLTLRRATS